MVDIIVYSMRLFCIKKKNVTLYYYAHIVILIFNANRKSILSYRVEETVLCNVKRIYDNILVNTLEFKIFILKNFYLINNV